MTSPFDAPAAGSASVSAPDSVPAPAPAPAPDDRDAREQYVLPLVVRLERATPPGRTDALETSARAVLTLLADPRVTEPDGEWAERVAAWEDARIRKVVRRARGGEWRRAGELPGITVRGREAEVRVFPPVPLDGWPKDLAKLQVSGTDLEETAELGAPEPGVPVLWLNPELEMSAGKTMAQTGHAAQLAWWRLDEAQRKEWAETGFALAVRTPAPEVWAELEVSGLPVVRDAGFTEIAPGSCTVIAEHPGLR
ncbi:peptidyl-tRNA hydrolase [Streptomyces kaniharaensis]|uniref:peptidyl-tRNA hydrolase n=1 Tax=Streptomyces kaniharaensis TaxID=212423 RepID=A0A6N7KTU6_9ACTN|nr:aminoacyl-tRNA hydrolase [Streptomyces kaniharaensis]MQS15062.1 peptidyl-tRNA hydrolase [Streptomyces kaniharaensis]